MKTASIRTAALALLFLASCAHTPSQTSSVQGVIEGLERQSWVAWQNHDGGFFARFLSDDHIDVHTTGLAAKAQIVSFVASGACIVNTYALHDMVFHQLSSDAAVLTYRAEQSTLCGTAPAPSPTWVTSSYVFRDGRWQNAIYVQTPAAGAQR